jgi:hypothetical protein
MKKMIGLIVAGLVLSMAGAYGQDAARQAMAEELLNLMNVKESMEKTFAMMKQMIPAQIEKTMQAMGQTNRPPNMSQQTEKIMALVAQEINWDKMKTDLITLYSETFTEDELKGVIAFYKSPAGQAFQKKLPMLMKRSMELNQKMMIQLMPKLQALNMEMNATPPAPEKGSK